MDLFTQPELTIHHRENNAVSEAHLNENREHFSKQTKKVFDLLMSGIILTQLDAAIQYKIHSLSRRACDILENDYQLTREFSKTKGVMEYSMTAEQILQNRQYCEQSIKTPTIA